MIDALRRFDFFRRLDEGLLLRLRGSAVIEVLRPQRILQYQGDKALSAWFLLSGRVRKIKFRPDGNSMVIGIIQAGEWIGLPEVVSGGACLCDVVTETRTDALAVPAVSFERLMKDPGFAAGITKELARGYYPLHAHLESRTPVQKISGFLAAAAPTEDSVKETSIDITQEALAMLVGLTRETVNKHLNLLQEEGMIRLSRGRIVVLDPARIRGLVAETKRD